MKSLYIILMLCAVHALDSLNVWARGLDGFLIHSTDDGMNWDTLPNEAQKGIYTVEFINADTGFIAGRDDGNTGFMGGVLFK